MDIYHYLLRMTLSCLVAECTLFAAAHAEAAPAYVILPLNSKLVGANQRQQLLVETVVDGRFTGDTTQKAKFASSNPAVATVSDSGVVLPAGNGEATITATIDGVSVTAVVAVDGI